MDIIKGLEICTMKIIPHPKGKIMHVLKKTDAVFSDFGEAYFSAVVQNEIKGWKRHTKMILNIVVPVGEICFVFFDDRVGSETFNQFYTITLGLENYCRITVPPMIWMAFKGVGNDNNLLLNIASIEHDPTESENKLLSEIPFNW
jgi:dTDP-4-dehydrorhamnose 3,5-epimerase